METDKDGRVDSLAWGVVVVAVALLAIGLVTVASASSSVDRTFLDWPPWRTAFGRQAMFSCAGLLVLMATARISTLVLGWSGTWRWLTVFLLFAAFAGLLLTAIPGLVSHYRGSARWLRMPIGSFELSIQPSELAKFALVAFTAYWLGRPKASPTSIWEGFLPAVGVIVAGVYLIGKADFGTAVLVATVAGLMLIVAGCRFLHLIPAGMLGAFGLYALLSAQKYRLDRLHAHSSMWSDPQGAGYQPLQSMTSIASGGWIGTGLGAGMQKHGYLPEAHTDFAFSILCEETGILGACLVIGLFCAMTWLGLRVTGLARTGLERLLAFGITATLGLQAMMNIAVATALVPTKGISLPLVSAGGSGTLMYGLALGILAGIAARAGMPDSIDPEAISLPQSPACCGISHA
jgi:cell division protein FtsW